MNRYQSVYAYPTSAGSARTVGHFDPDAAIPHASYTRADETLWLTAGGKWVLNTDDTWRYITNAEAAQWLTDNGVSDAVLNDMPDEQPVPDVPPRYGRPKMFDTRVEFRIPQDVMDAVDAAADTAGVTRAEWLRRVVTAAIG